MTVLSPQARTARLLAAAGVVVGAGFLASCTESTGSDKGPSPDSATSLENIPNDGPIQGQIPSSTRTSLLTLPGGQRVVTGSCLSIRSGQDAPLVAAAECANREATYRIVGAVSSPNECPSDVDNKVGVQNSGSPIQVACVDMNWQPGRCISLSGPYPVQVECGTAREKTYQPTGIVRSGLASACAPAGGFPHPARGFTVCALPVD